MTREPPDDFLRDLLEVEERSAVELLVQALSPARSNPSAASRERLLASALHRGRLWQFAERTAELLDVSLEHARALLDRLDDPAAWTQLSEGTSMCWVQGGPRVQDAMRGFLRIAAGVRAPEHEHLGEEVMFVLQGACRDLLTGEVLRPGDVSRSERAEAHAIEALSGGPDLLQLAVVQNGIRVAGRVFGPLSSG